MRLKKLVGWGVMLFLTGFVYLSNGWAADCTILHNFAGGDNGANPLGSLVTDGTAFYGMTQTGGSANHGVIFKVNIDGTDYTILHSFGDGTVANDGVDPLGRLILSGSTLYGMTFGNINSNPINFNISFGTAFKINTDGTDYTILHWFGDGSALGGDDAFPHGSLILSGSTLYGMTMGSAPPDAGGTVFMINTDGTNYTILHTFTGGPAETGDGCQPEGDLILSGSTLYGMTSGGGAVGLGTIFKINTDGTQYGILHSFGGVQVGDGAFPWGSLTLSGSTLYGMTRNGGAALVGVVFSMNTDGTDYTILHNFNDGTVANDGNQPYGSLILSGSTLYGMTSLGGFFGGFDYTGYGVVFAINTDGVNYSLLHIFGDGTVADDGESPHGSLIVSGPTLYGMTNAGGSNGMGTIFSINPQPVNGVCGTSNGGTFTSAPTSNLCSTGSPTTVSGSGPWSWTCQGVNGGANASCSANIQSQGVNGACGSANGEDLLKAPSSNLCSAGKASKVTGTGPWDWNCSGSNGGTTASCSAYLEINGACGSANGKSYLSPPISHLCNSGTPSAASNNGQWDWTCMGSNGGTTANCSAKLEINGACGSANKENFFTEPTSNLCSAGNASAVTGKGPWTWVCVGLNGGSKANCSANLEVNGACGSANGEDLLKAPTSNLCSDGKASKVTGKGPWDWTCAGSNGGTTASCSANLK